MRKFRVLLVTPTMEVGGTELSTLSLALGLKQRGHKVWVLSSPGPLVKEFREKGVKVTLGEVGSRNILGLLRGSLDIYRLVVENNIDIIHSQMAVPVIMGFFASRKVKSKKVRVIWHCRGIKRVSYPLAGVLFNLITDFVITNSNFERNKLLRFGLSPSKVRRVYNSPNLTLPPRESQEVKLRKEFNFEEEKFLVGMVGRLATQKGHQYFLRAATEVLKKVPKTKFLIVGGGSLEKRLRKLAVRLRIEKRVSFLGPRRDLEKILPRLDILVLPSLWEPLGNVLLEAMVFSRPVIATRVGGIPEIVENGVTGILVPPKNSQKLAEAMVFLLQNPEIARRMGREGRERVKRYFSLERLVKEVEEVYDRILKKNENLDCKSL